MISHAIKQCQIHCNTNMQEFRRIDGRLINDIEIEYSLTSSTDDDYDFSDISLAPHSFTLLQIYIFVIEYTKHFASSMNLSMILISKFVTEYHVHSQLFCFNVNHQSLRKYFAPCMMSRDAIIMMEEHIISIADFIGMIQFLSMFWYAILYSHTIKQSQCMACEEVANYQKRELISIVDT